MWPDRVSNPGPLTYKSGALPTALRGPAIEDEKDEIAMRKDNNIKVSNGVFSHDVFSDYTLKRLLFAWRVSSFTYLCVMVFLLFLFSFNRHRV